MKKADDKRYAEKMSYQRQRFVIHQLSLFQNDLNGIAALRSQ